MIINATRRDEPSTIIRVMGKYCINSPIIPGHRARGTKAANVVAVEAIIGQAISPTPFFVASKEPIPSAISLYTFSTTTIPLSTNIPSANTNEKSTIIFKLTPAKFSRRNEINIESGIATPTNKAFLNPRKNNSTPTTKRTPKMIEFSRLLICDLILFDWSLVNVSSISSGSSRCLNSFKSALILSIALMIFAPARFFTSSITTGLLFCRA